MLFTTIMMQLTRPPRPLAYIAADASPYCSHPPGLTCHRSVKWFRMIRIVFYATGATHHVIPSKQTCMAFRQPASPTRDLHDTCVEVATHPHASCATLDWKRFAVFYQWSRWSRSSNACQSTNYGHTPVRGACPAVPEFEASSPPQSHCQMTATDTSWRRVAGS